MIHFLITRDRVRDDPPTRVALRTYALIRKRYNAVARVESIAVRGGALRQPHLILVQRRQRGYGARTRKKPKNSENTPTKREPNSRPRNLKSFKHLFCIYYYIIMIKIEIFLEFGVKFKVAKTDW